MGRSSWIRDKNKSSQVLLSLVRLSLEIPQYLLSWLHPPHHHLSYSQDTYLQALPGTGWKLVPIPGSGQSGVAYPQIDLNDERLRYQNLLNEFSRLEERYDDLKEEMTLMVVSQTFLLFLNEKF